MDSLISEAINVKEWMKIDAVLSDLTLEANFNGISSMKVFTKVPIDTGTEEFKGLLYY